MSDDYRFRDARTGQGPANIGRGNRAAGRDYQDNRWWQHVDNRGGQYIGRDYHDRRGYVQHGDNYDIQVGTTDPFDAMASGRGIGRLLAAVGMLIALAGFGGFAYVVVSFITTVGPDMTGNPFAKAFPDGFLILSGIPIIPVAIAAVVIGGVLAAIGASMAKAARRRHERRMRYQRPHY